jgi:hypothetical protein
LNFSSYIYALKWLKCNFYIHNNNWCIELLFLWNISTYFENWVIPRQEVRKHLRSRVLSHVSQYIQIERHCFTERTTLSTVKQCWLVAVKISGKFVHISTLHSHESRRIRNWTQISSVSFIHTGIRAIIWAQIVRLRGSRVNNAKQDSSNLSIERSLRPYSSFHDFSWVFS